MSSPEGTQARRPLRTGGLALLALAAIAALIGLLVMSTRDDATSIGGRPTVTSVPAPGSPSPGPRPSPSPGPSPDSPVPIPTPPVAPPAVTSPTPGPGIAPGTPGPPAAPVPTDTDVAASGKGIAAGGKATTSAAVRVYNNSTIRGLATRAADDLRAAGWTVVAVDNYSAGRIPTTTVYYQEGTDERTVAEAIGAEFGIRVEPRFPGIADATPGVIVIVTNDYGS